MSLNFGQYTAVQKCLMGVVSSLLMFILTNVNAQDVRSTEKNGAIYSIQVLGATYSDKSGAVATDQSRILFYRSGTSRQGDAGSVFVNGMYHASLVAGAYSPICLRPGVVQVGVREMQVAAGPRDGYDSISMVDAKPGTTTYVRISEDGTRAQVVPEKIAESELANSKLQIHTISRVEGAEPCRPSGKARVQIAGDALFKFNRSDLNGLTGRGVKALDEIAQRLKQDYTRIDELVFAGYTDPLGNHAENIKLSRARAETVRHYLAKQGVQSANSKVDGRGPTELVVTDCSRKKTASAIACNQPNRRVVVEVDGLRR